MEVLPSISFLSLVQFAELNGNVEQLALFLFEQLLAMLDKCTLKLDLKVIHESVLIHCFIQLFLANGESMIVRDHE
jgi:hypothetical protein